MGKPPDATLFQELKGAPVAQQADMGRWGMGRNGEGGIRTLDRSCLL